MELFLRMNKHTKWFARGVQMVRFSERDGVCTYAYEYFAVKKLCPLAHCFLSHTYVHTVAVLSRKRAPASSRGETKPQRIQRKPTRKYFGGTGGHRNETGLLVKFEETKQIKEMS